VAGISLAVLAALVFSANYVVTITSPYVSPKLADVKLSARTAVNPVWPNYGSGAIGAASYDGVLARFGDKNPRPVASITKIITALVVLDKKPLSGNEAGPDIKLTDADQIIYEKALAAGAAVKPVTVSSSMTERQMLAAMLLPSAANYSETLAIWAFGSVDEYLRAADSWLAKNNLTQTRIVDTSGLSPDDTSTTSDLINLGKIVLKNTSLASITSLKKASIPDVGEVNNSNYLIGQLGINGIKTGTTAEAGACILFSSIINVGNEKITIVGVLLGADNRSQQSIDTINLLKSIQPGFRQVKVISRGQELANYSSDWGQTAKLISYKDINVVAWSNTPISVKVNADKLKTAKSGQQTGEVTVSVGNKTIKQPLIVDGVINSPNLFWRLMHLW